MDISGAAGSWSDDLAQIEGTLHRESLEGGFWTLVFGDQAAPHGGRLVLGDPPLLTDCTDGSRVRVRGRVQDSAGSLFMAGQTYEVSEVQLLG